MSDPTLETPVNTTPAPAQTSQVPDPADPAPSHAQDAPGTPEIAASAHSVKDTLQQSINRDNFQEEVGQVFGTLNTWWGGVKKQSASALTTLKADLDKTVQQAQADLEYLKTAKVEVVRKESSSPSAEKESAQAKDKGKGKEREHTESSTTGDSGIPAFFDLLASQTTHFGQTIQSTLQSTIDAAASNPALSNPTALRQQLAQNLRLSSAKENLQLSVKQAEKLAEEYMRKGDRWVKDAEKWMEDAVKVVSPMDEDTHIVNMGWDGSDFYSFSTSDDAAGASGENDRSQISRGRTSLNAPASSRKHALLRRLREDKQLLLVDPEGETESEKRRAEFRGWVKEHWEASKVEGRQEDEGLIGSIRMELVPEHLTDEQFWQRYLFHKHMIEAEEQRRKLLLQTSQQEQVDDFNWDDEPDDSTPPSNAKPVPDSPTDIATPKPAETSTLPASSAMTTAPSAITVTAPTGVAGRPIGSVTTSPRDSEESYDLVSDQGGKVAKVEPAKTASPAAADEEEDSDWE